MRRTRYKTKFKSAQEKLEHDREKTRLGLHAFRRRRGIPETTIVPRYPVLPPKETPVFADRKKGVIPIYNKEYHGRMVYHLLLAGLPDTEIALVLDLSTDVLKYWQRIHPEFRRWYERGRYFADGRVARELFRNAVGYTEIIPHKQVRKVKQADGSEKVEVIEFEERKRHRGDVQAQMFWLGNRLSGYWKKGGMALPSAAIQVNVNYDSLSLDELKLAQKLGFTLNKEDVKVFDADSSESDSNSHLLTE